MRSDPHLDDAKRIVNLPDLFREVYPHHDFPGLDRTRGGTTSDPKAGYEEKTGSFSISRAPDDCWCYNRHDGDRPGGDAITLLMDERELTFQGARAELLRRAGIADAAQTNRIAYGPKLEKPKRCQSLAALRARQHGDAACTDSSLLDGWAPLTDDRPEHAAQRLTVERRGLWDAASAGRARFFAWCPDAGLRRPNGMLPGATLFVVDGPDGQDRAYKYRNPGSKAELKALKLHRFGYLGQPKHSPAWCSAPLADPSVATEVWVEGENSAMAVAEGVLAAGLQGVVVQGIAGVANNPHVGHDFRGRRIYVYADPPEEEARRCWVALAHEGGAVVSILPTDLFGQDRTADDPADAELDACDSLYRVGARVLGERLRAAFAGAVPEQPTPTTPVGPAAEGDKYLEQDGELMLRRYDRQGNLVLEPLATFTAQITRQTTHIHPDGTETLHYTVAGRHRSGKPLKDLDILAAAFGSLSWVTDWGVHGTLYAGSLVRDHVRTAVMLRSADAERATVYHSTGWVATLEGWAYATPETSISADGTVPTLAVDLGGFGQLRDYGLPVPPSGEPERAALRASLALLELAPDVVTVPLLAATYRGPLGTPRYVVQAVGRTGSGKTALAGLLQAHFGRKWSADHLPATWRGTAFAILTLTHAVQHVLFTVDDFKPAGRTADVDKMQAEMGRLVAAVGDRAGRLRGSADGRSVQGGAYPRCAVLVTGETSVRGHSDAARVVQVNVEEDLLGSADRQARFSAAQRQAVEGVYAAAMAGYVRWIAQHHAALTDERYVGVVATPLRHLFAGRHNRTPDNTADLAGVWQVLLTYALHCGAVSVDEADVLWRRVVTALRRVGAAQDEQQVALDPVDGALTLLAGVLRRGEGCLRDAVTGGPPLNPGLWGWRPREAFGSDRPGRQVTWETAPGTAELGYLGRVNGEERSYLFLDAAKTYAVVDRLAANNRIPLPDATTLWRRVKERLAPKKIMLCEGAKTTYRRAVSGSRNRVPLIHLREDFSEHLEHAGTAGTTGTESALEPTGTIFRFVPVFSAPQGRERETGTDGVRSPEVTVGEGLEVVEESPCVTFKI